jgi:hypothetical protein
MKIKTIKAVCIMANIKEIINDINNFSESSDFMQYSEAYRQGYLECLDDIKNEIAKLEENPK